MIYKIILFVYDILMSAQNILRILESWNWYITIIHYFSNSSALVRCPVTS